MWARYWEILGKGGRRDDERVRELRDREYKYYCEGEELFTKEELVELRKVLLYAYWRDMSQGGSVRSVGRREGTFRPCAQDDDKGWKRIKEMLEDEEKFSYCMTMEELVEVIKEGRRLREWVEDRDIWTEEKNRQIRELKEVGEMGQTRRTKLEQERLEKMRKVGKQRC